MTARAFLICFVDVLNAMLLIATERFHEIGTMKCLVALSSLIIRLFLLESIFQGLVGTTAGILIGLGLRSSKPALPMALTSGSYYPGLGC